ncbi:MAG: DUF4878 domain-containing protein [Rikenellaceae bacterium]
MKKFFTFTLVAALFAVVLSCSSASNNTPSAVVETLAKSMKSGDYEAVSDLIYSDGSEESAQMKVAIVSMLEDKGAKTIKEMGGIESYEITSEEISEDGESAEVGLTFLYGNGETKEDTYDTINKDGKWYLEISK